MLRNVKVVMPVNDALILSNVLNLCSAMLAPYVASNEVLTKDAYQRVFLFCVCWGFAGLCEPEERDVFYNKMLEILAARGHKEVQPPSSIFDFVPNPNTKTKEWIRWETEQWKPPKRLIFSSLLIPTMDSTRAEYFISVIANYERVRTPTTYRSTLMVGAAGTAKTSTALMYCSRFSLDEITQTVSV